MEKKEVAYDGPSVDYPMVSVFRQASLRELEMKGLIDHRYLLI